MTRNSTNHNFVGVIDYQSGNLSSLINSIKRLNHKVKIIKKSKDIHDFNKIILPGVGSYERAVTILKDKNFDQEIKKYLQNKNLILGICLGMQIFLNNSEEGKDLSNKPSGLGLIDGEVLKFKNQLKETNIGWSKINVRKKNNLLFDVRKNIPPVYFVHQFYCKIKKKNIITSESKFGTKKFCSSFQDNNIFGTQFHPEKSSEFGQNIIFNFLKL